MAIAIRVLRHQIGGLEISFTFNVVFGLKGDWQWVCFGATPLLIATSGYPPLWCIPQGPEKVFFYSLCNDATSPPSECFSYNVATNTHTQFLGFQYSCELPIWSPGGSRLAFVEAVSIADTKARKRLTVYDESTREFIHLDLPGLRTVQWCNELALRVIQATPERGSFLVSLLSISDRKLEPVHEFSLPGPADNMAFSPNGEYVAYYGLACTEGAEDVEVCVVSLSNQETLMRAFPLRSSVPMWSPTGRHLAFAGVNQRGVASMLVADPPLFEIRAECVVYPHSDFDELIAARPSWFTDDYLVLGSYESVYPEVLSKLLLLDASTGQVVSLAEVEGILGQIICPVQRPYIANKKYGDLLQNGGKVSG
jgi:hypothetical protein